MGCGLCVMGSYADYDEGVLYPIKNEDYAITVDVIFEDDISFED